MYSSYGMTAPPVAVSTVAEDIISSSSSSSNGSPSCRSADSMHSRLTVPVRSGSKARKALNSSDAEAGWYLVEKIKKKKFGFYARRFTTDLFRRVGSIKLLWAEIKRISKWGTERALGKIIGETTSGLSNTASAFRPSPRS